MKATFKDAQKYLFKINKTDKVAIVCDNDLDGYSSGIIYYLFAQRQGAKVRSFVVDASKSHDAIVKQLQKFNKIIITDIGANKIPKILSSITNKDVFYCDHHKADSKVPKEILEYRTLKDGYIPSSRSAQELTESGLWIGLSGTLSDMGHRYKENDKYIADALKELKISQKKFLETVVFPSNKIIMYFYKNPQKSFQILAKVKDYTEIKALSKFTKPVEKEIQKFIGAFKHKSEKLGRAEFFSFSPKYPVKSTVTTILSLKNTKRILFFANPDKNNIKISARCNSDRADVAAMLKEATKGFKNSKAGGHARSAGTVFMKKDLKKFKEKIAELTKKL